jgi:hypothetical protein
MQPETNGWVEYKRLVLSQLEDLTVEVKELRKDVWQLKVQAAGWGGAAALVVSVAMKFILQ